MGNPALARQRARDLLARRPGAVLTLWQEMTAALVSAARDAGQVPGRDFEMVGWSTEEGYATDFLPREDIVVRYRR